MRHMTALSHPAYPAQGIAVRLERVRKTGAGSCARFSNDPQRAT